MSFGNAGRHLSVKEYDMKRIGIMTGTRAEYGLLKPLMRAIDKDRELLDTCPLYREIAEIQLGKDAL